MWLDSRRQLKTERVVEVGADQQELVGAVDRDQVPPTQNCRKSRFGSELLSRGRGGGLFLFLPFVAYLVQNSLKRNLFVANHWYTGGGADLQEPGSQLSATLLLGGNFSQLAREMVVKIGAGHYIGLHAPGRTRNDQGSSCVCKEHSVTEQF